MKAKYITPLLGALMIAGAADAEAKSFKRGVSENQFQYKAQMTALEPGVSWYYNWGNTPGVNLADFEGMEYIPMCWNGNYNADRIREYVKSHPETKHLLGFNEPNFTAQANMTPAKAAELWPAVKALADELGLKLVAPALNYSPNPPYQDPMKWMDEFVALVGLDAFDYMALHNYGGFGVMKDLCTKFHDKYGKEIWVTEFCLWPDEGNANSLVTPEAQVASMVQTVEWLEQTEWIYRYAWFKAIGNSSAPKGPNYGLLLSGKGEEPRELSEQGLVYVNMGTFDKDTYYNVNEKISAVNYVAQNNCLLGSTNGDTSLSPIEISQFNAGAWAQYQWDVPQAGDYHLVLTVTGYGEPDRFDPKIGVYGVTAEGEESAELSAPVQFALPDALDRYVTVSWPVHLEAGKQAIRIKDVNPYMPSGIRISAVELSNGSGVGTVVAAPTTGEVTVYNLQGLKVREGVKAAVALEGLPEGIYIIGGRKVRK